MLGFRCLEGVGDVVQVWVVFLLLGEFVVLRVQSRCLSLRLGYICKPGFWGFFRVRRGVSLLLCTGFQCQGLGVRLL